MTSAQGKAAPSAYDVEAEDGLLFGCLLDGRGGGALCDWATAEQWTPKDAPLWLHLDNDSPRAERWLRERSGVPAAVASALLARESRPRSLRIGQGLLVILRGVNLNEGAEPEDMVAIRIWVEERRIITVRYERLMTPRDVLAQILEPHVEAAPPGAGGAPALFVALADRLAIRMNDVILNLEDRLDELEEQVELEPPGRLRTRLSGLRQECVSLRRYLSPQREALANLQYDAPEWLGEVERMGLRETTDRTLRYLEDLEAARDRAVVVLDELANKMAETMNRTMYALSIVAAIFLPLSFLTGLLGVNVGGMPGIDSRLAFWVTCGLMAVLLAIELLILRRLRWI